MSAIRARFLGLCVAIVFVGSTRALQAMGIEYALEDCVFAAILATVVTAMAPSA